MDKSNEKDATRWLTVAQVIAIVGIARGTWDHWVARGVTPPYRRLPNGQLRVRADRLDDWLEGLPGSGALA